MMPWSLKRFHHSRRLHFITSVAIVGNRSSASPEAATVGNHAGTSASAVPFFVTGYVVMPEHVHLLISEPEAGELASAIQAVKQSVSRRLIAGPRTLLADTLHDFNVWNYEKKIEKLKYIHRNP